MKSYVILFAIVLLGSCKPAPPKNDKTKDTMSVEEKALGRAGTINTSSFDSICYLAVGGKNNQDTQALKLYIKDQTVTGKLMYLPHEKDSRLGNIRGIKKGHKIDAMWIFMQEGMIDSVQVLFKLGENSILQKQSIFDAQTGRETFPNTAQYDKVYKQIDCASFPKYEFDLGLE